MLPLPHPFCSPLGKPPQWDAAGGLGGYRVLPTAPGSKEVMEGAALERKAGPWLPGLLGTPPSSITDVQCDLKPATL